MARGVSGLRDLALFQVAIDTMLHGPDLFNLTVKDVQVPNGKIRSVIKVPRSGGMPPVRCAFSTIAVTRAASAFLISDCLLSYGKLWNGAITKRERSRFAWCYDSCSWDRDSSPARIRFAGDAECLGPAPSSHGRPVAQLSRAPAFQQQLVQRGRPAKLPRRLHCSTQSAPQLQAPAEEQQARRDGRLRSRQ
jgi:hypothetical protein